MWRRLLLTHLKTLSSSPPPITSTSSSAFLFARVTTSFLPSSSSLLSRRFSAGADVSKANKSVDDVMPIATGHEREELEAELKGRDILEINHPIGPFGTKENPAVVKSYYDRRIVGCPGGEGEDEHDVVWFWLEKDKPYECPVCTQYFKLEVAGPGGDPEGHH